jgi:cryptochrome
MAELSSSLSAINPNQRLHVLRGSPHEVFEWIFARWEGVSHLVYETVRCRSTSLSGRRASSGLKSILSILRPWT